jgi:hypothetical protein
MEELRPWQTKDDSTNSLELVKKTAALVKRLFYKFIWSLGAVIHKTFYCQYFGWSAL